MPVSIVMTADNLLHQNSEAFNKSLHVQFVACDKNMDIAYIWLINLYQLIIPIISSLPDPFPLLKEGVAYDST